MSISATVTPSDGKLTAKAEHLHLANDQNNDKTAPRRCRSSSLGAFAFPTALDFAKLNTGLLQESFVSPAILDTLDRSFSASMGRFTLGLSPSALMTAYFDWLTHISISPGKQLQLVQKGQKKTGRFSNYAIQSGWAQNSHESALEPLPQDKRFDGEAWRQWPFNLMSQGFLFTQQWWHNATTGVRGVTPQHERAVEFAARQMLDIFAPSNFIWTNPEVLQRTIATGGDNLVQGWRNFLEDVERTASSKSPVGAEEFKVGENIAVTPGRVVYRNKLMELIQYEPTTDKVRAEPILMIPAWIMKYYILDLSPANSLVKYLVDNGHTVFMVSWKNPGPEDRDVSFDDYRTLGVEAALSAVREITDGAKVHGVGYCLGGTLLGVAAAAMSKSVEKKFETLTFLASQFDFTEAGELTLFINESQVAFLEDIMWEQGYLDSKQMAGAFQMLRSIDLIWSRVEHDYLMGKRRPVFDIIAWSADATRMPYKMHSEYLRQFFLNNDLAEGRFRIDGRIISIPDIQTPIFSVATTRDHVAPWRSVYKIHGLAETEVTFLLTNGGHNAGIVSEPGHKGRKHRVRTVLTAGGNVDPDVWYSETEEREGSWWATWQAWIAERSSEMVSPPTARWIENEGDPHTSVTREMTRAPGTYVLMK